MGVDDSIKSAFGESVNFALIVDLQFVPQQDDFSDFFFQKSFGELDDFGIGAVDKAEDWFIQILCPSAYFVELIHGNTTE